MLRQGLHSSQQYQIVYKHGRRYDSRYVSVFVAPNGQSSDRFGITASRKAAKNAVDRNRMKRLLREAIRISVLPQLEGRIIHHDWVLNARRSLIKIKVAALCNDLQRIIAAVGEDLAPTGIEAVEADTPHQLEDL